MRAVVFWALVLVIVCWTPGCKSEPRSTDDGLLGGINYMQPFRWRMTYHYRVQEITPKQAFIKPRPAAYNPSIDAVGSGTYQVWFAGPREGEEVRNVKLIAASPQPTSVKPGEGTDAVLYYYDFAPDGGLPREISTTLTWEFITFERYTFWKGMKVEDYDKASDFYKEYTKEESPIKYHVEMKKVVDKIKQQTKGDIMQTALACYNYVVQHFDYDYSQEAFIALAGGQAMTDSYRAWENKYGVCDEFASTLCAMLRYAGIPARPVAGIVHPMQDVNWIENDREREAFIRVADKFGPLLDGVGHAWTEFYIPGTGWVPADPTWGQVSFNIDKYNSYIGSKREIPVVDYYFGKHDPFRITMFKDWNYGLTPAPKNGEKQVQDWMFGCTERTSGIRAFKAGWTGIAGMGG